MPFYLWFVTDITQGKVMAEEEKSVGDLVSGGDEAVEVPNAMWEDWEGGSSQKDDSQVVPPTGFWDEWNPEHDQGAAGDHPVPPELWEEWKIEEGEESNMPPGSSGIGKSGQASEVNCPNLNFNHLHCRKQCHINHNTIRKKLLTSCAWIYQMG